MSYDARSGQVLSLDDGRRRLRRPACGTSELFNATYAMNSATMSLVLGLSIMMLGAFIIVNQTEY